MSVKLSGTLVITIIDVNDFAPEFPSPWTINAPYYELELLEEQPEGTLIGTFTATDRDSNIARYEIIPPSDYFTVNNSTGKLKFKIIRVVDILFSSVLLHSTHRNYNSFHFCQTCRMAKYNYTILVLYLAKYVKNIYV